MVPDLHGAAAQSEHGVLQRGDALMLYTDGRSKRLAGTSTSAPTACSARPNACASAGFKAGAPALVTAMQREIGGSDDCALVLLWRT